MLLPLIGSSNHDVTLISIIFLMSQKIEVILLAKTTDSVCGPRPFWTELCLGVFYTQVPLGALVQDLWASVGTAITSGYRGTDISLVS